MKPQLLVKTEREGYVEKLHYGFVWLVNDDYKLILHKGDDKNIPFPFRSGAKPLQASIVIDTEAFKYFNFTHSELAVMCASHAGEEIHVNTVKSILNKIGLSENDLQCVPKTLTNNCSGKHAGMLAVCIKNGWDISNYLSPEHPLQKQIMEKIKELCHLDTLPPVVKDGCTAPVPVLPHYNMAVGYLNLFFNPQYNDIRQAMLENPVIVGGTKDRIDTDVMLAAPGKLLAKVSAEGACLIVNLEQKQVLIVRITDAERNARSIAVWDMLKELKWID